MLFVNASWPVYNRKQYPGPVFGSWCVRVVSCWILSTGPGFPHYINIISIIFRMLALVNCHIGEIHKFQMSHYVPEHPFGRRVVVPRWSVILLVGDQIIGVPWKFIIYFGVFYFIVKSPFLFIRCHGQNNNGTSCVILVCGSCLDFSNNRNNTHAISSI